MVLCSSLSEHVCVCMCPLSCRSNPYHNSRHAADVLQTFHMILHRGGLMPGYADQLTVMACYLAAVVHDYEHLGRSNDFLVNTHDTLAVRYNGRQSMHAAIQASDTCKDVLHSMRPTCMHPLACVICACLQTNLPWRTTTLPLPGSCYVSLSTTVWMA